MRLEDLFRPMPAGPIDWSNPPKTIAEVEAIAVRGPTVGTAATPAPVGGPGTELKAVLSSLGIEAGNCSCNARALQMDRGGVEWCREHRAEIVSWLKEEQAKRGWAATLSAGWKALTSGTWINPLDPVGSVVDLAIQRAADKQAAAKPA